MVKVLLHGCCGKMGRILTDLVAQEDDMEIVAGIDPACHDRFHNCVDMRYPAYESITAFWSAATDSHRSDELRICPDVVIDFSTADAAYGLLDFCQKTNIPLVLCTTGLSQKQLQRVEALADEVPVLRSSNMSLGVNLLKGILEEVTRTLVEAGFDMEIVEKHHNQKADAPSGTAVMLAEAMNRQVGGNYEYVCDRSKERRKRSSKEIGISSVRGGTIVGDHDVIFAGTDEVITFSHSAYSKAVFAKGAIQAAKFLAGLEPDLAGLWDMSDVLSGRRG